MTKNQQHPAPDGRSEAAPRRRSARGALVAATIAMGSVAALPAAAMAAAGSAAPPARCAHAADSAAEARLPELREAIACLLRTERRELGAGDVVRDDRLARAGRGQASQMVAQGFFAHVGPDGDRLQDRLRFAGWLPRHRSWSAGEILAWGTGSGATPASFVTAWMKSPTHFAVLRDRSFTQIGVGLVRGTPNGGEPGLTAAVEFGRR